jgi:hypothetical protein
MVVRFFPEADAKTYVSLALAYETAKDRASARVALQKGKRLFPDDQLFSKISSRKEIKLSSDLAQRTNRNGHARGSIGGCQHVAASVKDSAGINHEAR